MNYWTARICIPVGQTQVVVGPRLPDLGIQQLERSEILPV